MFWDSSAVLPLLIPESRSTVVAALSGGDRTPVLWWASPVECCSGLYRRHRERSIASPLLRQALARLDMMVDDSEQILPTAAVRRRARRLLATHSLSAADSLQLAAALLWCHEQPTGEPFACLDDRLREAALAEGFTVLPE